MVGTVVAELGLPPGSPPRSFNGGDGKTIEIKALS
jgi:hypothetical protein